MLVSRGDEDDLLMTHHTHTYRAVRTNISTARYIFSRNGRVVMLHRPRLHSEPSTRL